MREIPASKPEGGQARPGSATWDCLLPRVALGLGLGLWLWPIGFGGRMPVGGDVTQFSMGLMAFLDRALHAGRLPIWNDLWGFGFPGLAESQMGVFYPPHLFLYGLLPTEWAYTVSLVLHTYWGGFGAYWASRRFGASGWGSFLAGFAWATSGFFVIHFPHQWGYTTGSWMPWAWGTTWVILSGKSDRRAPWLLATILTLQVLPGHFQLCFYTMLGVLYLTLASLFELGRSPRRALAVGVAMAAMLPLAAVQLWPTLRLAQLAAARRDLEYLSGFAASPLHLISYIAPGLFQRSPLWRPLLWDPFHTSPEEHLAYIGLVPLYFAGHAVARGWRTDPRVRMLAGLALLSLLLSLGPYLPGFGTWTRLPGFSYFRAPARWGLATELALCLLAGLGYDAWASAPRRGRSLARYAATAAVAVALVLASIELAILSGERPGWPSAKRRFDNLLRALPGRDTPDFVRWSTLARQPQIGDLRVHLGLARQGDAKVSAADATFARRRAGIYVRELAPTAVLIAALLALALAARWVRSTRRALLALAFLDLWSLGRHRPVQEARIGSLASRSPVLARLGSAPRGERTVDPLRNMPMVASGAPVLAYRTLDLPLLVPLTNLAQAPLGMGPDEAVIASAVRASGAGLRILDPFESMRKERAGDATGAWASGETVRDPDLAGWLYDRHWVEAQGPWASQFRLLRPRGVVARSWLVPLGAGRDLTLGASWSGDPADVLAAIGRATPLEVRSSRPERLALRVRTTGPAVVLLAQLSDPQWTAHWIGPGGEQAASIEPAFSRPGQLGWQAVRVPGAGSWTLVLRYVARDLTQGAAISAISLALGFALYLADGRRRTPWPGDAPPRPGPA